jgi:hypothetical protein
MQSLIVAIYSDRNPVHVSAPEASVELLLLPTLLYIYSRYTM